MSGSGFSYGLGYYDTESPMSDLDVQYPEVQAMIIVGLECREAS